MEIFKRQNGDYGMMHDGVEAPFSVFAHPLGLFTVIDDDDEDGERPVAMYEDKETAERLALAFHEKNNRFGYWE